MYQFSDKGIKFLIGLESFKRRAYKDDKGIWTIGIGHVILSEEKHLLTSMLNDAEIELLFKRDIVLFVNQVIRSLNPIELSQNKIDALISICFNIGRHGFSDSTFVERIKAGKSDQDVVKAIMLWTKDKSLIGRRSVEARLFLEGNYQWQDKEKLNWEYLKG